MLSFAMLISEKAWVWQTPETLCWEESWLPMLLCEGFPDSCCYQESRCLFRFRARMSRASNISCHGGRANICPLWVSCQSCQFIGHVCSNPVHIHRQYWRKGTHAGASQWPLWENYSLHSFHFCKGSDLWRVPPWQCWKLTKPAFGRHLRPCVRKIVLLLMLLCYGFQESCRYQESRCRALNFCHAGRKTFALVQCLASVARG